MAGGGFPSDVVRLAFRVEGEARELDSAVARITGGATPSRRWRRDTTYWDDAERRLRGRATWLATTGRGARATARLATLDGPIRRRVWSATAVETPPALRWFATSKSLPAELSEAPLTAVMQCTSRGRSWTVAGPLPVVITDEHCRWHFAAGAIEERLLVVESSARAAPATLAVAEALCAILPLHLVGDAAETVAADRLAGAVVPSLQLDPPELDPAGPIGAGLLAIGRTTVRDMLANLDHVTEDAEGQTVHRFRVALRRLRAVLSLFRGIFAEDALAPLAVELKWLNGVFADAREWDVLIATTLEPLAVAAGHPETLAPLARCAEERRSQAYRRLAERLAERRPAGIFLRLLRWFELEEAPLAPAAAGETLIDFARAGLRRTRRRLKRHRREMNRASVADWHALRIRAKKARYAAEAFDNLFPRSATRDYRRALEGLQGCLGQFNDAAVAGRLAELCREDGVRPTAIAMVAGWTARERVAQQAVADERWVKFRAVRPFWRRG